MSEARPAMRRGALVLADGMAFVGRAFGKLGLRSDGEVVFNTSMTGYTELLTDPSYRRQILTLAYPEIGNYGACSDDNESNMIQAQGLVVRHLSPVSSSYRAEKDLDAWLAAEGIPALAELDTRALITHLRTVGSTMGILSTRDDDTTERGLAELFAMASSLPGMDGMALAPEVSCTQPYGFTEGLVDVGGEPVPPLRAPSLHVVVVDLGVKRQILRLLVHHGCRVTVVPHNTSAEAILALLPDGVLLSNGPGDPQTAVSTVAAVKKLLGRLPIFGICMGHQILAQAAGATTYKLLFGHRGANHPVRRDQRAGSTVMITSQNHGFAVDDASLKHAGVGVSERNLSDGTVEGIELPDQMAFGIQYHPEGAPGPHDSRQHFQRFVEMMQQASRDVRAGRMGSTCHNSAWEASS